MTDNVIVLGAGFSYDAGIPLLGNFIERMWEYSIRGKAGETELSNLHLNILKEALDIRREMDGYHGRVAFDDRNIEDILSMLVFNQLAGSKSDRDKLKAFTNAISSTIELACSVKHPGFRTDGRFSIVEDGPELYRRFWISLFANYAKAKQFPTIITFNYDLVLERALFQTLINTKFSTYDQRAPFHQFSIDYQYPNFPNQTLQVGYTTYGGYSSSQRPGSKFEIVALQDKTANRSDFLNIEILKLHGSLNFPAPRSKPESSPPTYVSPIENPYILPPVANKQSTNSGNQSWSVALQRLREAKNVIFCGYSMPITDTYMQFFLKAALGPNQELNKIYVFDPVLWTETDSCREMRKRFEKCFSEQLRSRIIFQPTKAAGKTEDRINGTTEHFVRLLEDKSGEILF